MSTKPIGTCLERTESQTENLRAFKLITYSKSNTLIMEKGMGTAGITPQSKELVKKSYPGTLFLIVGNSGSGKDSIISGAIKKYPNNLKEVYRSKRYITRPTSKFEDNYFITPEKFKEMQNQGKFALRWHIYDLDYGVPIEIDEWLKRGHPVIVNVSREVIENAKAVYENVKTVFIDVPPEITLKRIKMRGRECEENLKERAERARTHQKVQGVDFVVDNSGELDDAIDQFLNYSINIVREKDN